MQAFLSINFSYAIGCCCILHISVKVMLRSLELILMRQPMLALPCLLYQKQIMNKKVTSSSVASNAAKVLSSSSSSETAKKLAGSALSQANKGNETGKSMEKLASDVLKSTKYNNQTRMLAGSVVSQSNKKR